MLVSGLLKKENNNIDLLRLIAALAVIYGHAYAITPQPPLIDFVGARVSGEYSGSIAVKFFFFLSGLVVTNSLMRNPSLFNFLVARATRLLPALLVCLAITAFAVAPLFSILPFAEYYADRLPYWYFWRSLTFRPEWALPGVFVGNPMTAVNGSLWTLPIEANCYLMLFLLFVAAIWMHGRRWLWVLMTAYYVGIGPLLMLPLPFHHYAYLSSAIATAIVTLAWQQMARFARILLSLALLSVVIHGAQIVRTMYRVGEIQSQLYSELTTKIKAGESGIVVRADRPEDEWIVNRLLLAVPSYRGVPISIHVRAATSGQVAVDGTHAMDAHGRLTALPR